MDFNTWELERWLGVEDLICLGINRPLFFPKPPGYQAPPGSLLQAAGSPEAQDLPTSTAAVRASTASTRASLCSMPAATTEVGAAFTSPPEKRHQVVVVEKKKAGSSASRPLDGSTFSMRRGAQAFISTPSLLNHVRFIRFILNHNG